MSDLMSFKNNMESLGIPFPSSPTAIGVQPGKPILILLAEGDTVAIRGSGASNTGTVNSPSGLQSYSLLVGATLLIGPFKGVCKIAINGATGAIDALVSSAALTSPMVTSGVNNSLVLRTPDGLLRPLTRRRVRRHGVAADSETAFGEVTLVVTSITDNGDGTATVIKSGSFGSYVGEPIRIYGAPTANLNVMDSKVVAVANSGQTLTITLGGRTHNVVSSAASVIWPKRRSCKNWVAWLEMFCGVTFDTTWCAVPGADSVEINALVNNTTLTEALDYMWVYIGMNDVYSKNKTLAQAYTDITALIDNAASKAEAAGIILIPPRNHNDTGGNPPAWTSAKQAIHIQLNYMLYDYAKRKGLDVIDTWSLANLNKTKTWVIPSTATTDFADPEADFVVDFLHKSIVGAVSLGAKAADVYASRLGTNGWNPAHVQASGASSGNLITDGNFIVDTNADGVPDGYTWVATMTNTVSLVQRTVANDGDGNGKNFVANLTGVGTGTFQKNGFHTAVAAYVGQDVQFRFPFKLTNALGVTSITVTMFGTLPSGNWQVHSSTLDGGTDVLTGDITRPGQALLTAPVTVPAGLTALDIRVIITTTAAQTTAAVLSLWQPDIHPV
jgi:hypothetical protein